MWEITLVGQSEDYDELLEFCRVLYDIFGNDIIIALTKNNLTYFSIATNKKNVINTIKNIIYEIIIKINKKKYFIDNLNTVFFKNILKNFVLSSLIMIDIVEEINYLKKCTKLTNIINLNTFVYFRANKIILTWERVVNYLNNTYSSEIQEELYLQFLKFLADNNQSYLDVVYLKEQSNEILLYDKMGNKIKSISIDDEIGIIANLIIYSPQKLIINGNNSLSNKFTTLLNFIFKDKLSLIL